MNIISSSSPNGKQAHIVVTTLVTLEDAMQLEGNGCHPSQLSVGDRQRIALGLLLKDIGIIGHNYDPSRTVIAITREQLQQLHTIEALPKSLRAETTHVYDHLQG